VTDQSINRLTLGGVVGQSRWLRWEVPIMIRMPFQHQQWKVVIA
jgi:hypothetical protein